MLAGLPFAVLVPSMNHRAAFSSRAIFAFSLILGLLLAASGCGRTLGETEENAGGGNGGGGGGGGKACGDNVCGAGESCSSCAPDCGDCAGCGDGSCGNGETCGSCPQDCGTCAT